MIHDKLTYRMLNSSDKDTYYNFVKSFTHYYNTRPNSALMFDPSYVGGTPSTLSFTTDQMFDDNGDHFGIAGAFDGDVLVSTTSGYFPDSPIWYAFSQFSRMDSNSLLSAVDFQITAMKVQNVLNAAAEEAGFFNYYTRRTRKSQRLIDTVSSRMIDKKYIEFRYEKFYDGFYPPGVKITFPHHNFFKTNSYSDSLMVMYCLKQSEREKILKAKFPEYFS